MFLPRWTRPLRWSVPIYRPLYCIVFLFLNIPWREGWVWEETEAGFPVGWPSFSLHNPDHKRKLAYPVCGGSRGQFPHQEAALWGSETILSGRGLCALVIAPLFQYVQTLWRGGSEDQAHRVGTVCPNPVSQLQQRPPAYHQLMWFISSCVKHLESEKPIRSAKLFHLGC